MNVYVVEEFNGEDSFIVGIFTTEDQARQCYNYCVNRLENDGDVFWSIVKFDLDINHYEIGLSGQLRQCRELIKTSLT